jgi:hypothetical protein
LTVKLYTIDQILAPLKAADKIAGTPPEPVRRRDRPASRIGPTYATNPIKEAIKASWSRRYSDDSLFDRTDTVQARLNKRLQEAGLPLV